MTKTIGKKTSAETWLDTLDPATTPARDGRHLREIGRALTALERSEIDLREAVEAARAAGDRRLVSAAPTTRSAGQDSHPDADVEMPFWRRSP